MASGGFAPPGQANAGRLHVRRGAARLGISADSEQRGPCGTSGGLGPRAPGLEFGARANFD
eukprot:2036034-Alexandrium_andersonii.AAC.1